MKNLENLKISKVLKHFETISKFQEVQVMKKK